MLKRVHHVGYRVDDLERAIAMYESAFGGRVTLRGAMRGGAAQVAFVVSGETMVELIEPADKTGIAGKGLVYDHIGYAVSDLDAAMANLRAKGFLFADGVPTVNLAGWRMAFFDKSSMLGARVHLTEVMD
jgi:catechol 2,3-dioxygenase-like lactoylglutathione lyase family enzyme